MESDTTEDDGNGDGSDKKEGGGEENLSNTSPSGYFDSFQTDEYLDSWVTTRSSSGKYLDVIALKIVLFVAPLTFYVLTT